MFVSHIVDFQQQQELLYVEAVVDDFKLVRSQTWYEPAEYGPAACYATVDLSELDDVDPSDVIKVQTIKQATEIISSVDLDWQEVSE